MSTINPLLFAQQDPKTKTTGKYNILLSLFILLNLPSFLLFLYIVADLGVNVLVASTAYSIVFAYIYICHIIPQKYNFDQRHFDYWEMQNKISDIQKQVYLKTGSWKQAIDTTTKVVKNLEQEFYSKYTDYFGVVRKIGILVMVVGSIILLFF